MPNMTARSHCSRSMNVIILLENPRVSILFIIVGINTPAEANSKI